MMCSAWRWVWSFRKAVGCVLALGMGAPDAALGQETCATATPVIIGPAYLGDSSAALHDLFPGVCIDTDHDLWHSFVADAAGIYTISLCGSAFDTVAALYPTCDDEPLACNDDSCGQQSLLVVTLAAGQPYLVRVAAKAGTPGGSYRLQITPPAPVPPNNNICGGGRILPPNQAVTGSTAGATGNDSTGVCGGSNDRADVWYSFSPAASGRHIVELCSTAFNGVLSVHSSCFNATLLGCSNGDPVEGCPAGCGSRVVFNAMVGTTVLIRIAGVDGSFGPYSITIHTAAANDTCASALAASRGFAYNGFLTPAIATEGAASCAPSAGDVWHTYVATLTGPHTFSLCDSPTDTVLSVYTGCPGSPGAAEIACSDDGCTSGVGAPGASELVAQLTVGQIYYVRVAGRVRSGVTAYGPYTLRIDVTQPPNDECATAAALSLGVPVSAITSGATGTDITPCGVNDAHDVWYAFTPAVSGTYEFNTCGSSINTTLALFSPCTTQIACSDDAPSYCGGAFASGSSLFRFLNAGSIYRARIAGANGVDGPFRLVVNRSPPLNDDCSGAQVLASGVPAGGTLTGATPSGFFDCTGADLPDTYFSFTPAATRYYQISTCGSASKTSLAVYSVCPPATELVCSSSSDATCGAGNSTDLSSVLIGGMTERIRVSGIAGEATVGFQVTARPIAPPNDECSRARQLTINSFEPASTVGATGSDLSPCGAFDTDDIWFAFIPDQTGSYEFLTCSLAGIAADTTLALFESCGGQVLGCNDDSAGSCGGSPVLSRLSVALEAGHAYMLRAALVGQAQGSFYVGARVARPVNDTCATAAAVSAGVVRYDTLGADSDPTAMSGCGSGFGQLPDDVWFRFVAPASGAVIVSTCNSDFDTSLAVLDAQAGCAPTLAAVACNEDYDCDQNPATRTVQSRTAFEAVAGRAYFIRIGSAVGDRGAGELSIVRVGAPTCPCDWNHVGGLSVQDVFDFLIDWFAGRADINHSGGTELQDLFDFLICYLGNPAECR